VNDTLRCFKCGELDHIKANCPQRTSAAKAPAGAPSKDGAEKRNEIPVPARRAPEEIADSHVWAEKLRAADPRFGRSHCGDQGDLYTSVFRRTVGLGEIHECQLRAIAREQIAHEEAA